MQIKFEHCSSRVDRQKPKCFDMKQSLDWIRESKPEYDVFF